jgi:lincosamide nucleotidyltransferase A/C/D/E
MQEATLGRTLGGGTLEHWSACGDRADLRHVRLSPGLGSDGDARLSEVTREMLAEEALGIYDLLDVQRIECWVMGGWGVDALLGRVSRTHNDLDLLVHVSVLRAFSELVSSEGFTRKLEWSENRQIEVEGLLLDSAFVDAHPDGREIDVHVIDGIGAEIVQLYDYPWPLPPDALLGNGVIAGRAVRCVSRAAQLSMHSNYDLPEKHRQDVRLIEETV